MRGIIHAGCSRLRPPALSLSTTTTRRCQLTILRAQMSTCIREVAHEAAAPSFGNHPAQRPEPRPDAQSRPLNGTCHAPLRMPRSLPIATRRFNHAMPPPMLPLGWVAGYRQLAPSISRPPDASHGNRVRGRGRKGQAGVSLPRPAGQRQLQAPRDSAGQPVCSDGLKPRRNSRAERAAKPMVPGEPERMVALAGATHRSRDVLCGANQCLQTLCPAPDGVPGTYADRPDPDLASQAHFRHGR